MREIKFRVWDVEDQRMIEWPEFLKFKDMRFLESDADMTVLQFTGFKDIEGKEIYDDDIVSIFGDSQRSVVRWNLLAGLWEILIVFSGDSDEPTWELLGNHFSVATVIGNIHENPELLKTN